MIRRSWFRFGMANGLVAALSALAALYAHDRALAWGMVINAIGSCGVAIWALRKKDEA